MNALEQPAEEIMAGGPAMIEDGLFERWPVDAVFGMHNMPGLGAGTLHFRDGAMMAAVDNWEVELTGRGSHGSMPELSIDPVVAGSALVMALQTIVSRNVSPHTSAVVTHERSDNLGSEDFAFMLQKKRGTYCLLGNGDTPMVHHPQYLFNDDILPIGAAYWVALTERYLRPWDDPA